MTLSWQKRVKSASDPLLRQRAASRAAEAPVVEVIFFEIYLKLTKITTKTSAMWVLLPFQKYGLTAGHFKGYHIATFTFQYMVFGKRRFFTLVWNWGNVFLLKYGF